MIGMIISNYGICVSDLKHSDITIPYVSRDAAVNLERKMKCTVANIPVRIGIYTNKNCSKNSAWVSTWKGLKFIIKKRD